MFRDNVGGNASADGKACGLLKEDTQTPRTTPPLSVRLAFYFFFSVFEGTKDSAPFFAKTVYQSRVWAQSLRKFTMVDAANSATNVWLDSQSTVPLELSPDTGIRSLLLSIRSSHVQGACQALLTGVSFSCICH